MDAFRGMVGVDFETCSAVDLKRAGAWAYSLDESTSVLCAVLAYAEEPGSYRYARWAVGRPWQGAFRLGELESFLRAGGRLVAHNCGFEKAIWTNVLLRRWVEVARRDERLRGLRWPEVDPEQWRDTQALGLAVNLPPTLDGLAAALGAPIQKDAEGARLMKRMAKAEWCPDEGWHCPIATRENVRRLVAYCARDVGATLDCYFSLPPLDVSEARVWAVDQRVNDRGVYLDQEFAARCREVAGARKAELADDAFEVSLGSVSDSTGAPALKRWLRERGVSLPKRARVRAGGRVEHTESTDRNAVLGLLEREDLPADVRGVLENRVEANKATSLAKLARVDSMVGADGRLRGALQFASAHTGRWASYGLQLHNLPKDRMGRAHGALVRLALARGDLSLLKLVEDRPLAAISQSLRSVVAAPPGRDLLCGDYSAIEARVVAWLAGDDDLLSVFDRGEDVYLYTAAALGSSSRDLGKLARLSLGYGMGALKLAAQGAEAGISLSLKEWAALHRAWRGTNPLVVRLWSDMEDAARLAVANPGERLEAAEGLVTFHCSGTCLFLTLPSGRALRYWRPAVVPTSKVVKLVDEEGRVYEQEIEGDELRYFTVGRDKSAMVPESTYGGKLAENATQAVARDVLAEALVRVEAASPYEVVVHVHDSIAAEVPEGAGSVEEFCYLMEELPTWAAGLPIAVEGYRDKRFRG